MPTLPLAPRTAAAFYATCHHHPSSSLILPWPTPTNLGQRVDFYAICLCHPLRFLTCCSTTFHKPRRINEILPQHQILESYATGLRHTISFFILPWPTSTNPGKVKNMCSSRESRILRQSLSLPPMSSIPGKAIEFYASRVRHPLRFLIVLWPTIIIPTEGI